MRTTLWTAWSFQTRLIQNRIGRYPEEATRWSSQSCKNFKTNFVSLAQLILSCTREIIAVLNNSATGRCTWQHGLISAIQSTSVPWKAAFGAWLINRTASGERRVRICATPLCGPCTSRSPFALPVFWQLSCFKYLHTRRFPYGESSTAEKTKMQEATLKLAKMFRLTLLIIIYKK